ncbi:MAG: hypothetical protein QM667_01730 [Asticcacaulis sp.]
MADTPPVNRIGDRWVTAPLPGTPVYERRIRYLNMNTWPGRSKAAEDVQLGASPEPVEIIAVQDRVTAVVVSTTWQGFKNLEGDGKTISSKVPETPRNDCVNIFLSFDLSSQPAAPKKLSDIRPNRPCPDARVLDTERQLVIEGLDATGLRLFAVIADDPRWHIHEGADAQGNIRLLKRGRDTVASTYVDFDAPLDPTLKSLRIWQVEDDGSGQVIATVLWPQQP